MVKKDYIQDITDTLNDTWDTKKALKIIDALKSMKKQAEPSNDFKKNLIHKLECLYLVESTTEDTTGFSWFHFFWAFCSLVFVVGVLFAVFNSREDPYMISLPEPSEEQELIRTHPELKSLIDQVDESEKREPKWLKTKSLNRTIIQEDAGYVVAEEEDTTATGRALQDEDSNSSSSEVSSANDSEAWYTDPISENPSQESESESMPSAIMMQSSFNWDIQVDVPQLDFKDRCEEYNGEYNAEDMSCRLEEDKVCFEEKFYECRTGISEIDLDILIEELIREGGQ